MVLVAGGAGFIGSHMAKLLRLRGIEHLVVDNLENGHRAAVGESPFLQADLRQPGELAHAFRRGVSSVILFAGYASVGESVRAPAKYFQNNFVGCLNLLEAMRAAKATQILFSSSAAVYGEPSEVPITEDHPVSPVNPYGESKLAVERLLGCYARSHGFRCASLRYFNAAGADPEGELGEDHRPEEHLIPAAIEAALGLRDKLTLFGDDYDTPDGTCLRDYVHVCDLCEAHLLVLQALENAQDDTSLTYNLGSGNGHTVREVVRSVEAVSGARVPHDVGPRRPGDPAKLVAEGKRIKAELGWVPSHASLDTMVRHALEWRRAHPAGYDD